MRRGLGHLSARFSFHLLRGEPSVRGSFHSAVRPAARTKPDSM